MAIDQQLLNRQFSKAKIGLMSLPSSAFVCTILFSLEQSWNERIPTAGTDGARLIINPQWFMGLNSKEQIGLLAHEAWHVAFDHLSRGEHYDKVKYNIAADHVINLMLLDAGMELPQGALADRQYKGMSTEEIYKVLPDPDPNEEIPGTGSDIMEVTGTADEQAAKHQAIKDIVVKASVQSKVSGDVAGTIPGDIERALEEILNPKLDWFQILMNYMNGFDKTDYSYRRPNKRHMPEFILPGLYGESMDELALAFDASGSVSQEEFGAYFGETRYMRELLNPTKTTIIEFDTRINSVHELAQEDSMDDISFTGGGGTDLQPVFDHFKDNPPTVLVIFSDLYCRQIKEDPGYPVIWISVNNRNAEVLFGELIHYDLKFD